MTSTHNGKMLVAGTAVYLDDISRGKTIVQGELSEECLAHWARVNADGSITCEIRIGICVTAPDGTEHYRSSVRKVRLTEK